MTGKKADDSAPKKAVRKRIKATNPPPKGERPGPRVKAAKRPE